MSFPSSPLSATVPTPANARVVSAPTCWALFAAGVACFCLVRLVGDGLGPFFYPLAVLGSASCGFSWLLARALFRPGRPVEPWTLIVLGGLLATAALLHLPGFSEAEGPGRMIANLNRLGSSAVLLLALVEPFEGYGPRLASTERRFRLAFAGGYGALLAVAVVWVWGSPQGTVAAAWGARIQLGAAVVALLLLGLATRFRLRHPLPAASPKGSARSPTAVDQRVADAILRLLEDGVYTTPDLKVADLARLAGAPEYKVSRSITGALGFRNFNAMVNRYRIEHAQRLLSDPDLADTPILSIALDAGFGSIGPFNRAFKEQVGLTPRQYRASRARGPVA